MDPHPRSPALMRIRAAVRPALQRVAAQWATAESPGRSASPVPVVLVALSGGADSLALGAAVALEAPGVAVRAGAVIVDHGLQQGSAEIAERAAAHARDFGLDPVVVRHAQVEQHRVGAAGGLEAAARSARYAELAGAAAAFSASLILTAHTRDDQAEQVLLALVRGSGVRSLSGIPAERYLDSGVLVLRPLLAESAGITRADTEAACEDLGITPWRDPHNEDSSFARVRARSEAIPSLERSLGPGVAAALARTADLAREDADALDAMADELANTLVRQEDPETTRVEVTALVEQPAAIRNRLIRIMAARSRGAQLSREHTLAVAALIVDWRGQGPINVPTAIVTREDGDIVFRALESTR